MYRVWCLSWEEDESHGADVVAYDILSHDYQKEKRGVVYVPNTRLYDASAAAEAYADHVYRQRDGYESSWPLVFRVRGPDGQVSDFEVDCQLVPEFRGSPVKRLVVEKVS
jgi:hypothetical protein